MFKKNKFLVFLLITVFLLSGCSKTLNCTKNESTNDINIVEKISIKYKNKKLATINHSFDYKILNEESKKSWNQVTDFVNKSFNKNEESKGIVTNFSQDDKEYTFTYSFNIDLSKTSQEELENSGMESFVDEALTYDKAKDNYIKEGYTCK